MLAGIGIMHRDFHQRRAHAADGFEAHAARPVAIIVIQQGEESAAPLPTALAEGLAIDLRLHLYPPFGPRRLEGGERHTPEIVVRPRHRQQPGLEIEQSLLARLRACHGHPTRWRKRISEIHPFGLIGALALGSHSTQRTGEEELASVHGEKWP